MKELRNNFFIDKIKIKAENALKSIQFSIF